MVLAQGEKLLQMKNFRITELPIFTEVRTRKGCLYFLNTPELRTVAPTLFP